MSETNISQSISKKEFDALKLHTCKKNTNNSFKDDTDIIKVNPLHSIAKYTKKQMRKKEKKGISIYNENDFLSKIYDIMNYKPFHEFFTKYIHDFSDIQVAMLYFYLYTTIEKQFCLVFHRNIKKGEMVYMLKEIMSSSNLRKYFIQYSKENGMLQRETTTEKNTIQHSKDSIHSITNIPKDISIQENLLIQDLNILFKKNMDSIQNK